MTSWKLPYNTRSSSGCFVITWGGEQGLLREGGSGGRGYTCTCICTVDSLCGTAETQHCKMIVLQLKKKKKK